MAYCPKCGVEVDNHIEKCPLCTFPVPDIGATTIEELRFPTAENIYPEKMNRVRNTVYFAITVLCFVAIIILITIYYTYGAIGQWIKYSIISILSGWLYFYFFLGYVKTIQKSIIGIGSLTLLLTVGIDAVNRNIEWSVQIAWPIVISFLAVFLVLVRVYKRFDHPVNFIFIISYSCIGLAIFLVILQSIISIFIYERFMLNWSIIVFFILASLALILLGVYYKLPDQMKEKLKRKFHI